MFRVLRSGSFLAVFNRSYVVLQSNLGELIEKDKKSDKGTHYGEI